MSDAKHVAAVKLLEGLTPKQREFRSEDIAAVDRTRMDGIRAVAVVANADHPGKRELVEKGMLNHLIADGHSVQEALEATKTLFETGLWKCKSSQFGYEREPTEDPGTEDPGTETPSEE